jgi:outer membrane protein insertion porin family
MYSHSLNANCTAMRLVRTTRAGNARIQISNGNSVSSMKNLCITILLTLTVASTTLAQAAKEETAGSQIVERVNIRGNRRITESEIKAVLSTRKRRAYQPQILDRDMRALYETGHFEDVKVYVENGLHGGKIVTFEVSERSLIFDIEYEGIDKVQQAEVSQEWSRQKIDLSKGSEFDFARIKLAEKIMQEFLTRKENRSVRVSSHAERLTATDVLVVFRVESRSQ